MNPEDLKKNIKEKFLFDAPSGCGKTNLSLKIAKIYAMNDKKIIYIDSEKGTDRDLEKIFGDLTKEQLNNIQLINATNINTYIKYMYGWEEDKSIGTQVNIIQHGLDCDLKVLDGIGTEMELFKTKLSQRFQDQGFYTIGDKRFEISNKETFVLPFNFYAKVYDQIKEALVVMLDHKYDIIATLHPLKDTKAQMQLKECIYQKFDSIIRLNKEISSEGFPKWNGTILKNRGKESPDKSNTLESIDPILKYFINKFNMPMEETIERLK